MTGTRLRNRLTAIERRLRPPRGPCARCGGQPVALEGDDGRIGDPCPACGRPAVLVRRIIRVRLADV